MKTKTVEAPKTPTPSPIDSDSARGVKRVISARCGICLRHLAVLQPGGLDPRHADDNSPYCGAKN